jgi:hypothetical protein
MATKIKFIEDKHQYVNPDDRSEKWISVTSLIHSFSPKKDWNKIAERYAKKHGRTVEDVKKEWEKKNRKAIERGVKFHKQREEDLVSCETINVDGTNLSICRPSIDNEGHKLSPPQKLEDNTLYPELLVTLNSARICGQADYVEVVNGYFNIKDFKTNQEIKKNGFVNWEGIEERMIHPVSDIPNSNYWHYALQLNTYAYIIKRNNPKLKIGKLELLHIQFDENDEEVENIQIYQLPDLQKQVKNMIEYHKTKNNI